jgi:hypothetical protein
MRNPYPLARNLCITLLLAGAVSICALAATDKETGRLRDVRRGRRDIAEALQPTIAVVGKDKSVVTAGAGVVAIELPAMDADADFIATEEGHETAAPTDDTIFLGTSSVEADTATAPETTATAPETTAPETAD